MGKQKHRILVVDDDRDLVESLRVVLEANGYDVDGVYSIEEADQALAQTKPDLIVLDVMLSTKSDGFHMSYKLKKDPELKDIPILMLTGIESETGFKFSKEEDEEYLPVEEYVTKPVENDALLAHVKRLLEQAG